MIENTFIAGYWGNRPENIEQASQKITRFLLELKEYGNIFLDLKSGGRTKKEAMNSHFDINEPNVFNELKKRRNKKGDMDESQLCEIGFAFSLFNEENNISMTISFCVGSFFENIKNHCYIDIHGVNFDNDLRKDIVSLIVNIFQPETIKNQ